MNKKYVVRLVGLVVVGLIIVITGSLFNLWNIGFKASSLIGFIAVVPACLTVFSKGLNYVNSAVYFAGIGFIMYKNVFAHFSVRFFIFCVLLCAFAIILPATAKLFDNEEKEKGTESNG